MHMHMHMQPKEVKCPYFTKSVSDFVTPNLSERTFVTPPLGSEKSTRAKHLQEFEFPKMPSRPVRCIRPPCSINWDGSRRALSATHR